MVKRKTLFAAVLLVAVVLLAGSATSAFGYAGGVSQPCSTSGCHGTQGAAPVVTLKTNDGTNATYQVTAADAFEWAVFKGTTRVTGTGSGGNTATAGTFTVRGGSTYTIFAVYAGPGDPTSGGQTTVSPEGAGGYTVTATAGANGTISPSGAQSVASGGTVTFTMTPATGYRVADVLVNGASVGAVTTYTFTNVTADATISVTFAPDKKATSTTLKANAKVVKVNTYVTLTAKLVGGGSGCALRFEVMKPGQKTYKLMKTVKVGASGVATYKTKVTAKGTWTYRVRFLGDDTHLPAPLKSGIKVIVK
jgi:hypothetical protein